MNRTHALSLLGAAGLMLMVGCGGLIKLNPSVTVPLQEGDPLGLQGEQVAAAITGRYQVSGNGSATGTFADVSAAAGSASQITINQSVNSSVTVTVPSSSLPETINLTDVVLTVSLADGSGQTARSTSISSRPLTATLTRASVSGTTGTYTVSGPALSLTTVLNTNTPEFLQAVSIVTSGGTNTATGVLTLKATATPSGGEANPDLPVGTTITLTLGSGSGSIRF